MPDGSVYFRNSVQNLTIATTHTNFLSGNYTVEFFYNVSILPSPEVILYATYTTLGNYAIKIFLDNQGILKVEARDGPTRFISFSDTAFAGFNRWTHVALSGEGNAHRVFINGEIRGVFTSTTGIIQTATNSIIHRTSSTFAGMISNLRCVKGRALYTTTFFPSIQTLTSVTSTVLLTCVDNNAIVDRSGLGLTITINGNPAATSVASSPFVVGAIVFQEDFNPYLDETEQKQRWQNIDFRPRY